MAGLNNKIPTDGLTTHFPKAMPMILPTDEERVIARHTATLLGHSPVLVQAVPVAGS